MRVNWTRARDVPGAKASGKYQLPTETIALPPEFWSDLKQILGLLTQSRLAELTFDQPGQYVAAKLEPLIRQVRSLVEKKEGVWDAETLAGVRSASPPRSRKTASRPETANRWPRASGFIARFWTNILGRACRSNGP
jgi:hypothetical protein